MNERMNCMEQNDEKNRKDMNEKTKEMEENIEKIKTDIVSSLNERMNCMEQNDEKNRKKMNEKMKYMEGNIERLPSICEEHRVCFDRKLVQMTLSSLSRDDHIEESVRQKILHAYSRSKLKAEKRNLKGKNGKDIWMPKLNDLVLVKQQPTSDAIRGVNKVSNALRGTLHHPKYSKSFSMRTKG
jgi:hypothetical protein